MPKKHIVFVCTGNSIRSQMAEGIASSIAGDEFEFSSAGIMPIGIHPDAVACMKEIGVDISQHDSKMLSADLLGQTDYLVTVCDSARDKLPILSKGIKHIHMGIENPDRQYDSDSEKKANFARVREDIRLRITGLLNKIKAREI